MAAFATLPSPDSARRRFVLLTFVHWLAVGLLIPVHVLLLTERGLALPVVGALFALYGVTTAVLELPTGGLADVIGRRAVLCAGVAAYVLGTALIAFGRSVPVLALGMFVAAVARALSSGPLEAWYVDTVHAHDPDFDLKPGLSQAYMGDAIGLSAGALAGGALPRLVSGALGDPGRDALVLPLSVPALASVAIAVVELLLLVWLVPEPPRERAAGSRAVAVARGVLPAVRAGVVVAGRDRVVRMLLLAGASSFLVIASLEVLSPGRFAAYAGDAESGAGVYGVVIAAAFASTAIGYGAAPRLARQLGSPARAIALSFVFGGLALVGFAALRDVPGAACYVLVYCSFGPSGPLLADMLHARVTASRRATLLSAQSLLRQAGGLTGAVGIPWLATATSMTTALAVAGVILGLTALPSLAAGRAAGRVAVPDELTGDLDDVRLVP